jgi:hypothetical protein
MPKPDDDRPSRNRRPLGRQLCLPISSTSRKTRVPSCSRHLTLPQRSFSPLQREESSDKARYPPKGEVPCRHWAVTERAASFRTSVGGLSSWEAGETGTMRRA